MGGASHRGKVFHLPEFQDFACISAPGSHFPDQDIFTFAGSMYQADAEAQVMQDGTLLACSMPWDQMTSVMKVSTMAQYALLHHIPVPSKECTKPKILTKLQAHKCSDCRPTMFIFQKTGCVS
jgi:hypothetical protein